MIAILLKQLSHSFLAGVAGGLSSRTSSLKRAEIRESGGVRRRTCCALDRFATGLLEVTVILKRNTFATEGYQSDSLQCEWNSAHHLTDYSIRLKKRIKTEH